jgi:uncharacterized phage-associated protein
MAHIHYNNVDMGVADNILLSVYRRNHSMLTAIDVAYFFVDLANTTSLGSNAMTNLRVNKLLYFAQAHSLVRFGKPLFDENIQAWKYGPVVPSVYQEFKHCGNGRIQDIPLDYTPEMFSTDEIDLLLDVVRHYGQFSSSALVGITHKNGSPWKTVYHEDSVGSVIPADKMKVYFSKEQLPVFEPKYDETDVIGTRNSLGYLVLPKEYDDDAE